MVREKNWLVYSFNNCKRMLEIHGCFDITEYFKKCKAQQVLYYYGGWSDRCFQPWAASYLYSLIDHNFESHEDMIGFCQVEDIISETLFKSIKDALNRMDIPLTDCRGQCYDGASNMVGKNQKESKDLKLKTIFAINSTLDVFLSLNTSLASTCYGNTKKINLW